MTKIKVAVGLSGGVDSAVSAYLLKKQGFDVSGVYLHCFDDDAPGCRGKQDRQDALSVALHLKIPFQVLDFRRQYKSSVIDYFKKEYLAGRTPNPDVICNRDIKFGLLLDWCVKNGFDYLATGHYARLVTLADSQKSRTNANNREPTKLENFVPFVNFRDFREALADTQSKPKQSQDSVFLAQPKDLHKDQTYFLWAVPRQNFSRVLFPLADFRKKDVRSLAKFAKIPVAAKPDSTGICFIGEVRVENFLKQLGVKEKRGEVVIKKSEIRNPKSETNSNDRNPKSQTVSDLEHSNLDIVSNFDIRDSDLSSDYEVVGKHKGVWFYTIGQRRGFEVNRLTGQQVKRLKNSLTFQPANLQPFPDRPPLYVISKDVRRNRLIVSFGPETYRSQFVVSDTNWLIPNTEYRILNKIQKESSFNHSEFSIQNSVFKNCLVRIRHLGDLIPCSVIGSPFSVIGSEFAGFQSACSRLANRQPTNQNLKTENRELTTVFLAAPQRGVAPGQSAVFYSKAGLVLGGGVIQ